jgi:hypothetical protein
MRYLVFSCAVVLGFAPISAVQAELGQAVTGVILAQENGAQTPTDSVETVTDSPETQSDGPENLSDGPEDLSEGLDMLRNGARIILRGLMDEVEPALREMEPELQALFDRLADLPTYQVPQYLPNGDILIRRRVPLVQAPPQASSDRSDEEGGAGAGSTEISPGTGNSPAENVAPADSTDTSAPFSEVEL